MVDIKRKAFVVFFKSILQNSSVRDFDGTHPGPLCDADVALALTSCPCDARAKKAQVPRHLQSWAAEGCTVQDVNGANSPPLLAFII